MASVTFNVQENGTGIQVKNAIRHRHRTSPFGTKRTNGADLMMPVIGVVVSIDPE